MGSLPFAAREGEEDQYRGLLQFCSGNTWHHGHHPLISQVIYFAYDAENQLASRQVYNDHMRFPFFGGEIGLFSVFFFTVIEYIFVTYTSSHMSTVQCVHQWFNVP